MTTLLSEKLLPHVAQLLLINETHYVCIYKIRLLSMAVVLVYNGHYILMVLSQCSG